MEPDHWFDSLHRILTREASRRGGLGAAAVLLASHILNGGSVVEAARKKRRKNKNRKKKRQKRKPQRQRPACAGEPCLLLGVEPGCCEPGLTCCGGLCVNTTEDDNHCGGCNQPCSPGKVCFGSTCECLAGLTLCGEICRDTMRDPNNCRQCGRRCPAGWECDGGECVCRRNCPCPADRVSCNGQCCPPGSWCFDDRQCCPATYVPAEVVYTPACAALRPEDTCRPDSSFVCCEGFGCFVGTDDPTDWVCCGTAAIPLHQRTCVRSTMACLPGRDRYAPLATHTYGE